ncbi:MAG: 4Fe-4S cluster-binding domain-containing protein [Leptospiraceae bacterium]|nr:4Fe-4S cluster-binding domain-containing protein [Leptospiraceae bacterium]MCB1321845.1 4Fe-4S cluster-binding domain-containing protein [Leptospiraceae bacterium]
MASVSELRISETYLSLQGEGKHTGWPCFFIRTAVCDIRCRWCDTPHALMGGDRVNIDQLIALIPDHVRLVQITGGEPLVQHGPVLEVIKKLEARGKKVLLETGGHRSLESVPATVHIVMDIKLPSSGEDRYNFAANLTYLKSSDEIKFVIADRSDFDCALQWMTEYHLADICEVLFSPVWDELELKELAEWILAAELPVRLQTQLHKHIWGGGTVGV